MEGLALGGGGGLNMHHPNWTTAVYLDADHVAGIPV